MKLEYEDLVSLSPTALASVDNILTQVKKITNVIFLTTAFRSLQFYC